MTTTTLREAARVAAEGNTVNVVLALVCLSSKTSPELGSITPTIRVMLEGRMCTSPPFFGKSLRICNVRLIQGQIPAHSPEYKPLSSRSYSISSGSSTTLYGLACSSSGTMFSVLPLL